jgi:amidase
MIPLAPLGQATAFEVAALNVQKRDLQKMYMEYWNSTVALTSTGRPVDAILQPALPFAAARPGKHTYYGHTAPYNVLDYTAAVLPVTKVDKVVDVVGSGYTPKNDEDRANYEACKCSEIRFFAA